MTPHQPYAEYKSAGVPWLDQVPAEWPVVATRVALRLRKEVVVGPEAVQLLSLTKQGVIRRDIENAGGKHPENYDSYQMAYPDDLIFCLFDIDETPRTVGITRERGMISGAYTRFETTAAANPEFVTWYFIALDNEKRLRPLYTGLRKVIQRTRFLSAPMPIPPLETQTAIANFLDRETARIDELIRKQERLIELLAEKRQAVITNAVTKGLDPTAPTKPSGIPWQGPVPDHWTVQPLKNLMRMQTGVTLGKDFSNEITETYAYLRVANVQIGYVDLSDVKEIELPPAVAATSMLRPGDVLMTEGGDRDKLARGCIWDAPIQPCVHQNHIFAVRTGDQLLNDFLVLALDADPARTYFYMTGKQSTNLASTNSTTVKNFRFGLPPIAEQRQIVAYLTVKTGQIDVLTSKASLVIAALKERRAALISAAVTGKINVVEQEVMA